MGLPNGKRREMCLKKKDACSMHSPTKKEKAILLLHSRWGIYYFSKEKSFVDASPKGRRIEFFNLSGWRSVHLLI